MQINKLVAEKKYEAQRKSLNLQDCYMNEKLSFDIAYNLKKEQDKEYKRYLFFSNLQKALEKANK